ncbi:BNR-4 repeat-containing protein [Natronoglomus mannanivorans]|uniref:BNR-4 repeat-containing protein n=1 Tax=Natronoglomus mannanivorans TaxID=2979990 RepID=A0AAP3E3S3_9EURY|nr:BNR-4 repeat-containing protein [Halobacteria archaeon AArc-xg1-1]
MNEDNSLSHGLLGHWSGERSPDGIVRDRSLERNDGAYGLDARWIWFTNPRAIRHIGEREQTYVCYLGGSTGTDIVVGAYDHGTRSFSTSVVVESFSTDDHTNPSLTIREDGRILVFWAGHNGDALYYTVSREAENVTAFESPRRIEQDSVTYPNPVWAPDDPERLYLFYRDRTQTRDATNDKYGYMGDGNLYYRVSDDGGLTWGKQTQIIIPPEGHYSMYFLPARGDDKIHFFFTDAERGGDAPKWNIMYAQLCDGCFYTANGTLIAGPDDLPMTKDDLEMVYDSAADGNHYAWVWDSAVDDDGNPIVAYATFPSTLAHEYRYARWDGDGWRDYHLANAGRYIARRPIELHYSGGLSLDRDDPSVVYGCVSRGEKSVLKRFETDTGGESWAELAVTKRPIGCDIRPVVPRNAGDDLPVFWLTGSYKHMDTSQTVLRGLPADHLSGQALEGDTRHGVDLGFDRYDAAAFADGVTVASRIEPRDVTSSQVIANFGSGITLGIGLEPESGVVFSLAGSDGDTSVTWDEASANERYHVAGTWNGTDRLALAVDGETVDETRFDSPIDLETEWASWTLLKGEYLIGDGYDGIAEDVRLYDRALSTDEIRALAD